MWKINGKIYWFGLWIKAENNILKQEVAWQKELRDCKDVYLNGRGTSLFIFRI